jgi:hypothetical protein
MDHQTAFVRQVFGNTSLGPGATAFQGSFPSCTFNTIAGLPPEMFPHLQMFMRNMIPGNSDAQYDRLCTSVTQLGFLGKAQRQLATGEEAKRILGNIRSIMQGISQPASLVETDEARDMLRKESLQAIDRILTTSQEVHINKSEGPYPSKYTTTSYANICSNPPRPVRNDRVDANIEKRAPLPCASVRSSNSDLESRGWRARAQPKI